MSVPPLDIRQIIVDSEGRPTPEFLRWFQEQRAVNEGIPDLSSASSASSFLDALGTDQGVVLYRDAANWAVLAPATAGRVLATAGPDANPVWTLLTFLGLDDTPASFATHAGKLVAVNTAEDALEFVEPAEDFTDLGDVPSDYTGEGGKLVAVKGAEDGLEFVDAAAGDFEGLTDTPSSYSGEGGKFVAVNSGATALEFVDAPSGGGGGNAVDVTYDNTTSGATATDVQAALDKLFEQIAILLVVEGDVSTLNVYSLLKPADESLRVSTLSIYSILEPAATSLVVPTLNVYVIMESST